MLQSTLVQYLLDTNILLALVRGGDLSAYLQNQFALLAISLTPIISVVTEAELRMLAVQNNWGSTKRQNMETLISYFVVVPIPYKNIVEAYVEIDSYSRPLGRKMGKNDLWIAATTKVEGATLLTTDKDFDHLNSFIKNIYIDPTSHL